MYVYCAFTQDFVVAEVSSFCVSPDKINEGISLAWTYILTFWVEKNEIEDIHESIKDNLSDFLIANLSAIPKTDTYIEY